MSGGPTRRAVVKHGPGFRVTNSDFATTDQCLAHEVAKELDRIAPLTSPPDFVEARQRLYDLLNEAPLSEDRRTEADELVPIVAAGLDEGVRAKFLQQWTRARVEDAALTYWDHPTT